MIKNTNKHLQLLPKLSHHLQLKTQKTIETSLNQFFEKRNDPHESVKSVENLQENVKSMPSSPLLFPSNAASYTDGPLHNVLHCILYIYVNTSQPCRRCPQGLHQLCRG